MRRFARVAMAGTDAAAVLGFLRALGWAGLAAGDYMEQAGARSGAEVEAVRGQADEIRALAIHAEGILGVLAPFPEDGPGAQRLVRRAASRIRRLSLIEGHLPELKLPDFDCYPREVAVGWELGQPRQAWPAVRPGRPEDAVGIQVLYEKISWMGGQSASAWRERLARERAWVVEEGGTVIAAARWTKQFAAMVEVGGVATLPELRRQGAASAVTLAAGRAALDAGYLPVLRFGDLSLVGLYQPLGFLPVGRELSFHRRAAGS